MKIKVNIPLKKLINSRLLTTTIAATAGLAGGYILGKKRGERLVNQEVLNEYPYQPELNFETLEELEYIFDLDTQVNLNEVVEYEDDAEHYSKGRDIVKYEAAEGPGDRSITDLNELAEGLVMESDEESLQLINKNVFDEDNGEWNYAIESRNRDDVNPYIIHEDEFHSEESGFDQVSLYYYAGDNVLAEEDNTPIPDHERLLGELKFGHGSSFKNTCFVRNPVREMEYEVLKHEGTFLEEVYGNSTQEEISTEELKHSISRKFRDRDLDRERD